MGVIYKITHIESQKMYVGQTRNDPWQRWCSHISEGRIHPDIKLNKDQFSFEVIECCPNSLLNDREMYWIKALKTLKPYGLNAQVGGNSQVRGKNFLADYLKKLEEEGRLEDYENYDSTWNQLSEYDEYKRISELKS